MAFAYDMASLQTTYLNNVMVALPPLPKTMDATTQNKALSLCTKPLTQFLTSKTLTLAVHLITIHFLPLPMPSLNAAKIRNTSAYACNTGRTFCPLHCILYRQSRPSCQTSYPMSCLTPSHYLGGSRIPATLISSARYTYYETEGIYTLLQHYFSIQASYFHS